MGNKNLNILRRYTNLPATIHLLRNKAISLLDPNSWEDKNDTYFLKKYIERRKLKSVTALCLTEASETFHHWKLFAANMEGICIEFKKDLLLNTLKSHGVLSGKVHYKAINEISNNKIATRSLPFMKRLPYVDEAEFRLIYPNQKEQNSVKNIEIPLSCIYRINISPWMPEKLSDSVKEMLRSLPNWNSKIKLNRSTLIENERWKKAVDDINSK